MAHPPAKACNDFLVNFGLLQGGVEQQQDFQSHGADFLDFLFYKQAKAGHRAAADETDLDLVFL